MNKWKTFKAVFNLVCALLASAAGFYLIFSSWDSSLTGFRHFLVYFGAAQGLFSGAARWTKKASE